MSREERAAVKERLIKKLRDEKEERKRIRSLSGEEKKKALGNFRNLRKEEKGALASLPPEEKKAQRKFLKKYNRLRRRPVVLSVWGVILFFPIFLILINYIQAVRPYSQEIEEVRAAAMTLAAEVQAEGTVLLENHDQSLPLEDRKINVFGSRSITPSYGGGGSGSISPDDAVTLYEALESEGFEVNRELEYLYSNWRYEEKISTDEYRYKKKKSLFETILPNIAGVLGGERFDELDPREIPDEVLANAKNHSDTALMVIGLFSREAISTDGYADKHPDNLTINDRERAHLELLNREFDNIVILVNSGNPIDMGWVEEFENIKSVLWIGYPGESGFTGIARILSGDVNPSARLADTFAYDPMSAPAARLVGNHSYENLEGQHFMNYTEGIYIGYRFYETYYEGNEAGYRQAVKYPFGYGLSYTSFEWETGELIREGDSLSLIVNVTNTGERAGKEVVQLYYSAPYYEGGIEKSAINLGGFAKTELLDPGESQKVAISLNLRDLASYDYKNREAWVLEPGLYSLKIARNVHDTVDVREFSLDQEIVYRTDSRTGVEIRNLFDDANGGLNYLSRADFEGTLATLEDYNYTAPQSVIDALQYEIRESRGEMPVFGEDKGIELKDLKGLDYDDPAWEDFLDQFKLKEMIKMVSSGGWQTIGIDRLGIPQTLDYDGPASIRHYFGKWSTVGFPNAMTVSQTWNSELQHDMGKAIAEEGALRGIHVWYAPGMNIHRSTLGARSFEYFSEDPVVTGKTAAALIRGAYTEGVTVTIKHFAMNNQETNRTGVFTWASEQAMREIFLKSFEISVKEANPYGAMSAMNRIGHTWCGDNSILLNDLLRREWGFRGFVVSDITIGNYMKAAKSITNGNDLMLFLTSGSHEKNIKEAYEMDPVGIARGLRNSVHNISYMVLQTHAMDEVK